VTSQRPAGTPRTLVRGVGRLLLFAAVVLGVLAPMPATSATPTICVALVVDFTPLSGGVDSGCTRVPRGANGYDVLRAGGHTYQICANGIIGTIDGQPANGCQIKDNTHFWGYWHRKPGSRSWTFSTFGAGGYHPVEGSTEGWVWEDGKTSPPANTAYPAGCHSPPTSSSPSPRPTARSSSASGGTSGGTNGGAGSGATSGGTTTGRSTAATGSTGSTGSIGRHDRPRHRPSASASASAGQHATPSASTDSTIATPTPTSTAGVLSGAPPATDGGSGHLAPLAAGLGVAALLGAGAWWRSRRAGVGS
jgi:hypothetical protein